MSALDRLRAHHVAISARRDEMLARLPELEAAHATAVSAARDAETEEREMRAILLAGMPLGSWNPVTNKQLRHAPTGMLAEALHDDRKQHDRAKAERERTRAELQAARDYVAERERELELIAALLAPTERQAAA
jgi:hypothetical protein